MHATYGCTLAIVVVPVNEPPGNEHINPRSQAVFELLGTRLRIQTKIVALRLSRVGPVAPGNNVHMGLLVAR